jgi:hypothetical protein
MPHLKKTPVINQPTERYTVGHSVPKTNRRATFNPKLNTYTRQRLTGKYAGNYLIEQGIGKIQGLPEQNIITQDAWSVSFNGPAFGNGF